MTHIHAKEIKAWADGAVIEYFSPITQNWVGVDNPAWAFDIKYRIKALRNDPDDAYRQLLRNYIDIKLKYEALVLAVKSLGDHYA